MGGQSSNISTSAPMLGALRVQQSSYSLTLAVVYGQARVSGNLGWYGDFVAIPHTETENSGGKGGGGVSQSQTTYTYEAAVLMCLAEGSISAVKSVWRGKERYSDLPGNSALNQLGLSFSSGANGQAVWGYLTTYHPTEAIGYSNTAIVYGASYQLTDNAEVHNHNFEVVGKFPFSDTIPDADPSVFIPDVLTSLQYGASMDAGRIASLSWFGSYVRALGLFLSPAMTKQRQARDWINDWCRMLNSEAIWSEGKLKIIPYGDSAASGNGSNFVPDTTPQYDLTVDDFITDGVDDDPVLVDRTSPADAYNKIIIEYLDRENQYNVATTEASDMRAIELYGERAKEVIQFHDICDGDTATLVAHLILQRELYIRNKYKFRLGWRYSRLEPMDLVTLTDDVTLDHLPVRITKVVDTANGELDIEAEDWPLGIASATKYPHERGSGFAHEYNAEPGPVTTPVFFEAPVTRTTTGLEVYVAVSGADPAWGGCHVWASLDGDTYREVATLAGGCRYGQLTATLAGGSGGTASVALTGQGGQMLSGSPEDALTLQTLCWVGDETAGEYFAYGTATLTGTNAYDLTGLVRDGFNSGNPAHASGQKFVRVDQAIAKSGPLDIELVGKPIFFKFTSFNVYGGGVESLADVEEYAYYITGYMLKLPPSDVAEVLHRTEKFGVTVYWPPILDPDVKDYHVKIDGTNWDDATEWGYVGGTSFPWEVLLTGGRNVWVKARDIYGYESENATLGVVDVDIPGTDLLTVGVVGPDAVLNWVGVDGSFAFDHYELRHGTTWAGGTFITRSYTTTHREKVSYVGLRRYWVAAVDVAGNVGAPVSVDLTITAPGAVTSKRSEVIDNNVLLYWGAPTTGNLPVERYDVRKGATWAGGTVVGSNGNSTFTTVFEQVAGTYTYWIAAIDSAGNVGSPTSIVAQVNQPPDYVLRNNFDSVFAGTKTNMFLENGYIIGPVSLTQTWSTHFSGNGYTDIDDQIAAGMPLYIQPSLTSGAYEEQIDYGAAVPATMVTVTVNSTVLDGSVSVACQIAYKLNVGDSWTNATAGTNAFIPAAFRYLKMTLTFTCTAGANTIRVDAINIKLANKLKTDSGTGTANSGDSGGTTVNFGTSYVDVISIQATPRGTSARFAVVDFADIANPVFFKVLLFDAAGTRVSGDFDWTARGY